MHPNFLIIGPPKCASTSLHFYLGQHPEVYVSKVKETNFFTHDYHKGMPFYENYFKDAKNEKAIGEATPAYSFLPFVRDRIYKHYPDMKFILCFRNPIERAFSNWLMHYESGVEKLDFRSAIEINLKQLSFVSFEGSKGAEFWDGRRYNSDRSEKWIRTYLQPGMYADILNSYFSRFKKEQLRYIFLEDLKHGFHSNLKDIYTFLEIKNDFVTPVKEVQNYFFNRKIYRLSNTLIGMKNTRLLATKMPNKFKNIFKQPQKSVQKIPEFKIEDRKFLWDIYKLNVSQLELITGRNLDCWIPK